MTCQAWMFLLFFAISQFGSTEQFNTYFTLKNDGKVQSEQHFYDCLPYYLQQNAEQSEKKTKYAHSPDSSLLFSTIGSPEEQRITFDEKFTCQLDL
jgi:hypothetical protein